MYHYPSLLLGTNFLHNYLRNRSISLHDDLQNKSKELYTLGMLEIFKHRNFSYSCTRYLRKIWVQKHEAAVYVTCVYREDPWIHGSSNCGTISTIPTYFIFSAAIYAFTWSLIFTQNVVYLQFMAWIGLAFIDLVNKHATIKIMNQVFILW